VERAAELGKFGGKGIGEPDPAGAVGEILMVELAGELHLRLECGDQRLGEGYVAVFASFPFADDDLFAGEVEVFDAEAAGFHQAEPGTVEQAGDGVLRACRDEPEDGGDFKRGEDDGKFVAGLGPDGVEFEFGTEEFLIEEEQGGEGLVLGAGGDLSVDSEVGEEGVDFAVGELVGVDPFAVEVAGKAEVAVDPGDVGFFGPFGDVEHPHFVAELLEQFGLFGWGGGGIFLHGWRPPVEFRSV